MSVFVDDQYAVDSLQCFLEFAELEMYCLRRCRDLFVAEIAKNSINTGECQINRLKDLGGLLGKDIQGRRKLFVGAGKGILVIDPAGIHKKRRRKKD